MELALCFSFLYIMTVYLISSLLKALAVTLPWNMLPFFHLKTPIIRLSLTLPFLLTHSG